MGDSNNNELGPALLSRIRGFPAYYLGDVIPQGFIKPFETLPASISETPQGEYSLLLTDRTAPNQRFTTPIYQLKFQSDPKDLDTAEVDAETGKKEKIYTVFIDYTWITDKPILTSSSQVSIGGFDIPKSGTTIVHRIHIISEERFMPPIQERGLNDSYILSNEIIYIDIIPYFLAGDIVIQYNVIGPVLEDIRFARSITRLLPSRSLSLWVGFSGNVSMISALGDPGATAENFALNFGTFGGGLMTAFGLGAAEFSRRMSPVIYKPFTIKFGYSVVGSSETIFDDPISIAFEDMFEYDADGKIVKKFIEGKDYVLINKSFGSKSDFISKVFGVFRDKFDFEDLEKRYIGNGLSDSGDPREGVSQERFLESKPIPFAVVKEKVISSTFTRQVKKFRKVNVSIPEEQTPNGGCNVQIYLPKSEVGLSPGSFATIVVYATYEIVKKPQFRQVNSYLIRAATTSASNTDASSRHFYQSNSFAYDTFYANKNILYKFDTTFTANINVKFDDISSLQGIPPLFDQSATPLSFRTPVSVIGDGSFKNSEFVSPVSTYRLCARQVQNGSEDFTFSEGIFLAASKFTYLLPGSNTFTDNPGGIGYIDGTGSFTLLIAAGDILDSDWWDNYFGSVGQTISIFSYFDEFGVKKVRYDRSVVANSLFTDDEKISYDIKLAEALTAIVPLSKGGPGIGICLLDFLDVRNFNVKNEFASFSKYKPADSGSTYYTDLSEAYFEEAISPNWILNVVQILNPRLDGGGILNSSGSITAEAFCFEVSPLDLTRKGRIFFEGVQGTSLDFEQVWVRSNLYDIKLGFASDYQNLIGLYARQYTGILRVYPVTMADFFSFNISRPYGYNYDEKVILANKKISSSKQADTKWHGFPVDRLPFHQNGYDILESESDGLADPLANEEVQYKTISSNLKYVRSPSGSYIELDKPYRLSSIRFLINESIASTLFNDSTKYDPFFFRYVISLDAPYNNRLLENETVAFASFSKLSLSARSGLMTSTTIPNYLCSKIYLSGPVFDLLNAANASPSSIKVTLYDAEIYENASPKISDCYPAIDGFTQGYISMLNSKDSTSSIDIYTTGDSDRRWSLFRNVFQCFSGENVYQCIIKADQKGRKLYLMFSLNGNLLFKPLEGWTISSLKYHNQKVEPKSAFLIGTNSDVNFYALYPDVYSRLQNIDINNLTELDHSARLQPSYVVQANYLQNDFLEEELINTSVINAIQGAINKSKVNNKDVPPSVSVNVKIGAANKNVTVTLPNQVTKYRGLLYPRIAIDRFPESEDPINNWSVSQPYTFEVLGSGDIICFVLKEGYIHVLQSSDGKYWSHGFGLDSLYGFRPIKWGINDQNSSIDIPNKQFSAGLCPPIDNISSCYDTQTGKLTLFYVINNAIFGQNFHRDQLYNRDKESMFRCLQTGLSTQNTRSRPFYVIGEMPQEMIDSAKKGENFVNFGIISDSGVSNSRYSSVVRKILIANEYLSATSNLKTNGKAPGACFIGAGLIRMYYEDEEDKIRGVTINDNYINIDLLIRGKSIDAEVANA